MATKSNISMLVDVIKNTNTDSKYYGKYYGRIFTRNGLNLKGFAKHVSEHGSLVKYDLMVLVLQNIVTCMKEMMTQGVPVKLDGLGTFSPGIENASPADTVLSYDPLVNIKGVKINFRPEGAGDPDDKLTKTALKDITSFEMNDYVEVMHKTVDGKDVTYQKRTPISQLAIAQAEPDPENP